MKLTPKQQAVISFVHTNGQITTQDAMGLIDDHYRNGKKHVGDVLSRMVKSGLLNRVKPGVFVLGAYSKPKPNRAVDPAQTEIEFV